MAKNDKTLQKYGALVYLAGRNFITNSDSPQLVSGGTARPFADQARAGSAYVAYDETIRVVTQPTSQNVSLDDTATFTVVADGAAITYQWQYSADNGATWGVMQNANVWIGKDTDTLSFLVRSNYTGWMWRCKMASAYETVYSDCVTLNIS